MLERVPSKMIVIEILRPKYVDPDNEDRGVIVGKLPPRPVDKGMAGQGLLADVLVSNYGDHLPLYRQQQRFRREGIEIAKSTLGGWISQSAWHLEPLYDALKQEALLSGYLQADETRIQVQDRKKKGKTHRGFYWAYPTPEQKLFVMEYRKSRARAGPVAFLGGYAGALQTDGYVAYDVFEAHPSMTVYGCMAHARRKFYDCLEYEPEKAEYVLEKIRQLYAIERRLREEGASAERRRDVRQQEARPVLEKLKPWLEANGGSPKSPWGQATNYTLGLWTRLSRYLDEGRVELDNNLIENALRPLAIGCKNYLFAGSHDAAQRAAVVYSLLGTCKLIDRDRWGPHGPHPPTPPCVRVRTRRFNGLEQTDLGARATRPLRAGSSDSGCAVRTSVPSPRAPPDSPGLSHAKGSVSWIFCRIARMSLPSYYPCPLFGPSSAKPTTMPWYSRILCQVQIT